MHPVYQASQGRSARMEGAALRQELDSVQNSLAYASKQLESERATGLQSPAAAAGCLCELG